MLSPTERFSSRVADYVRYRPHYPREVIGFLESQQAFWPGVRVADVGSGTGIFSRLLLEAKAIVEAVEPNEPMRLAGLTFIGPHPRFTSHAGTAEATGLDDESVDLVTAAQAFHWFDREKTKAEFQRILRPGGHVALLWNERLTETSDFLRGYEALLGRYAPEYAKVDHRNVALEAIRAFFAPEPVETATFAVSQVFGWDGVRGRLTSSSYCPAPGDPGHAPLLEELEALFNKEAVEGKVSFDYATAVFCGRL